MSNNSQISFNPQGKTIVVAATAVAPAGITAPTSNGQVNCGQYRVINNGTVPVFLGVGATAAEATTNAVAPVAGTPSAAIVLLPGAVEILRFGSESFFSGLSSVAATVYITPGQGL